MCDYGQPTLHLPATFGPGFAAGRTKAKVWAGSCVVGVGAVCECKGHRKHIKSQRRAQSPHPLCLVHVMCCRVVLRATAVSDLLLSFFYKPRGTCKKQRVNMSKAFTFIAAALLLFLSAAALASHGKLQQQQLPHEISCIHNHIRGSLHKLQGYPCCFIQNICFMTSGP
jgi:hypothetical protein